MTKSKAKPRINSGCAMKASDENTDDEDDKQGLDPLVFVLSITVYPSSSEEKGEDIDILCARMPERGQCQCGHGYGVDADVDHQSSSKARLKAKDPEGRVDDSDGADSATTKMIITPETIPRHRHRRCRTSSMIILSQIAG